MRSFTVTSVISLGTQILAVLAAPATEHSSAASCKDLLLNPEKATYLGQYLNAASVVHTATAPLAPQDSIGAASSDVAAN